VCQLGEKKKSRQEIYCSDGFCSGGFIHRRFIKKI